LFRDCKSFKEETILSRLTVEVNVELCIEFVELIPDYFAHLSYRTIFSIVFNAVVENEVDIINEFLNVAIPIRVKFVFNGAEVHWLGHHVIVVGDFQFLWVNWVVEDPGLVSLPKLRQQLLCRYVPRLKDTTRHIRGVFRQI